MKEDIKLEYTLYLKRFTNTFPNDSDTAWNTVLTITFESITSWDDASTRYLGGFYLFSYRLMSNVIKAFELK